MIHVHGTDVDGSWYAFTVQMSKDGIDSFLVDVDVDVDVEG